MPKVTFEPDNITVDVEDGENLLRCAMLAEVHINASCGGQGTCGKCRLILVDGKVDITSSGKLTGEEIKNGYVLACSTKVLSDVTVKVPPESQIGDRENVREEQKLPAFGKSLISHDDKVMATGWKVSPRTRKLMVTCDAPSLQDNISDLDRLKRALRQQHQISDIKVEYAPIEGLADKMRAKNWVATVTICDEDTESVLVKVQSGDMTSRHFALVFDIGTTTIVGELIDLNTGEILAHESDYNAQISYGDDVISRIVVALKPEGLAKMKSLVVSTVNSMIMPLAKTAGVDVSEISSVMVAGNTIMMHLLYGMNPKYIREEPYVPTATSFPTVNAAEIGLALDSGVKFRSVPSIASYVGGDIVAGIVGSGFFQSEQLTLFLDIGTNGELALGNQDWLVACSCSAGPAFEGGGLKHGMRAAGGAIEQVRINRETLEPSILTIGQSKPLGICGSGLIDAVAELFLAGGIDERGKFNREKALSHIIDGASGPEYVLADADMSGTGQPITLSEVDIDNLMRAKAAIFAGIKVLLDSVSVSFADIDRFMIAGAFGSFIETEKAIIIGLFPELDAGKFDYIGNGSLMGARGVQLSKDLWRNAAEVARKTTYIELSVHPDFMNEYISALFLPHTDINLFPAVKAALQARTGS